MKSLHEFTLHPTHQNGNYHHTYKPIPPVSESSNYLQYPLRHRLQTQIIGQPNRSSQHFWDDLYAHAQDKNKKLIDQYQAIKASADLYRQSLSLKNKQLVDIENRVGGLNKKLHSICSTMKNDEDIIKKMSQKCHSVKEEFQNTRIRIRKEQSIIVEQQKHYKQIEDKIVRLGGEMKELKEQIKYKEEKSSEYNLLIDENRILMDKFSHLKRELELAEIKEQKEMKDEANLLKKIQELRNVISIRQSKNKGLWKKLNKLKKNMSSNEAQSNQDIGKVSFQEITHNINELQAEYGSLQQNIMNLHYKIQETNDKIIEKSNSVRFMQDKKRQYETPEVYSPQRISHGTIKAAQNEISSLGNKSKVKNEGKTYRVIESEEDQYVGYQKMTENEISHTNSFENQGEDFNTQEKTENGQANGKAGLKMTPSLDKIISRFSKIVNKDQV